MEHVIESPSPVQRKISFTVPAAGVNVIIDATVRSMGRDISLDGFRKGKVPASVIEKRFHDEVINKATDTLINNQISALLEEKDINPVNRVQLEGDEPKAVVRDQDFSFTCFFEVLPDEIKLPEDLTALSVEVETPDLKPEEVDAITKDLQRRLATLEEVTEVRKPVAGDVVLVDVEGTFEGKQVAGMNVENFLMMVRDGSDAPEVDALVRTLNAGEEGTGTLVCPEGHPDPSMRGKTLDLKVRLHKINTEKLPELDEEFAKKVGFEDIGKLRKAIFEQALSRKLAEIKARGQEKLMDSILKDQEYELPESIVNKSLSDYLYEARDYMVQQGMKQEDITEALKNMREEGLEKARVQAKAQCFLMALGFREKITVSEQDADRAIQQMAAETKQDATKLRDQMWQSGMINDLQERLMAGKALELLYNKAHKIVVDADGNPVPPPSFEKPADAPAEEAAQTEKSE